MLFLFSCKAIAFQLSTKPIRFSDTDFAYKVNDHVRVFATADTISSQEAWTRIISGQMEEVPYQGNPGMTNSDRGYWLVFSISNESRETAEFRLVLSYPQLDLTGLSEIQSDTVQTLFITGDSFKFSERPIKNHDFVFPLNIPYGSKKTYLLNADKRNSAVRFPLKLYAEDRFVSKTNREQTYLTVYYSFLILLTILSLLVGVGLKKNVFIWYAISVLCYTLWLFTWQGFSYKYLTGNYPELNRHFLAFCSQIAIMSLLVFVQSFFETKKVLPKFHKLMNGVLGFFILGTIVWIIIPDTYVAFAPKLFALRYLLVGLILVFCITAAIKYRKRGLQRTIIFSISYVVFFISIVGKILDEYGIIGEYNFVIDPILIGNMLQVLGLSSAMVITLINIVKDREILKNKNEELIHSLRETTSSKVEVQAPEFITLKSKAVLQLDDIQYISSDAAYCEFYLVNREHPEIDRRSLSSLEEELPENFVRIHRSTIVNLNYAKQVKATAVVLDSGQSLVVSRTYKDQLREVAGDRRK